MRRFKSGDAIKRCIDRSSIIEALALTLDGVHAKTLGPFAAQIAQRDRPGDKPWFEFRRGGGSFLHHGNKIERHDQRSLQFALDDDANKLL